MSSQGESFGVSRARLQVDMEKSRATDIIGFGTGTDAAASLNVLGLSELDPAQYQRVQRTRSNKASVWLSRPLTLPNLIISAVVLEPLERLLLGA